MPSYNFCGCKNATKQGDNIYSAFICNKEECQQQFYEAATEAFEAEISTEEDELDDY